MNFNENNNLKGPCREEDLINVIRDLILKYYGIKSYQILSDNNKMGKQIDC